MYVGQLAFAAGGHHHEIQVGPLGAAVKHLQIDVQLFAEVAHYLGLDVGLGRGGEAQHRRNGLVPGPLADEAPHVTVVWAEVVSPPGEAVGFVQHPRADFPLGQDPPKGDAAQLFRRDEEDSRIAQTHPVQGVSPLRH